VSLRRCWWKWWRCVPVGAAVLIVGVVVLAPDVLVPVVPVVAVVPVDPVVDVVPVVLVPAVLVPVLLVPVVLVPAVLAPAVLVPAVPVVDVPALVPVVVALLEPSPTDWLLSPPPWWPWCP